VLDYFKSRANGAAPPESKSHSEARPQ